MEFGLIGERLGHSFSAELHRAFGRYDYGLMELSPAELGSFLKARNFAGLNVTIPYKEAVLPYLDRLDEQAAAIGAVNTIVNRDGVLWGYNTDFEGMAAGIRRMFGLRAANDRPYSLTDVESACLGRAANDRPYGVSPLSGKSVLILGTGGTSKTALAVCRALGAAEAVRVSRTRREDAISYEDASKRGHAVELLMNCTPAGMWPNLDGLPFTPSDFPNLAGVFDCVYNPLRTRLVLEARARGIPADGGLYMLVKQAALACERFTGAPVEDAQVDIIFNDLRKARENPVLIGMPSAGKSTVARLLAQKTGREFVDLDEEIVQRAGMSVPAIFASVGEAGFRELEAAAVRALAGRTGLVIATGGGTVLRPENVTRLKQNGRLFFLDRPPEALEPSPDRPLGDTKEKLEALYGKRYPVYTAAADVILSGAATPEDTARAILEAL